MFLILKFIWKCVTCCPCCSLIVLSFGQEKKMILCHTWILWSHWYWMNYTSLWEMRLDHFCLLWAIYVFFFFFLDTLSLITPLSLLISLSFLKPLSIVFQDGIWSVCFNVVVVQEFKEKERMKRSQRKKKTREKKKKERCQKEENKKGFSSNFEKWNVRKEYCFEEKELTFWQILKTLLIIYHHPFLFHSLCFYPTLRPNKVLIWSWRLCSSDIDITE